jgi:linoleate 10R-lipoxygenase
MTSSYLDLSPLYGSSQKEQDAMRTFKDGKLKPDCFSETRLLGFPPGVGCILIMFNRFHNYVADQLPVINENGRFTKPGDALTPEQKEKSWEKYDNDLFQTARWVDSHLKFAHF